MLILPLAGLLSSTGAHIVVTTGNPCGWAQRFLPLDGEAFVQEAMRRCGALVRSYCEYHQVEADERG